MAKLFKSKTLNQHTSSLTSFLPAGDVFLSANIPDSNLGKLMTGFASELKRVFDDINDLSEDYDIVLTSQLLSRWEAAVGIPDSIFPGDGGEITRRLHALIKFAKMHVQTAQQMATLVTALGFQDVDIQPLNNLAYPPYNVPFFPVDNPGSRYIITIYASGIFLEVPPYDVPFTPAANNGGVLNLILELVKPQNVQILFRTDEADVITPISIPDCTMWLDASDTATVTLSGLNLIDTWADKVGDNNAIGGATQPTWVTGIQNGRGIARFSNAQAMEIIGSTIYSVPTGDNTTFVVIKQNSGSDTDYVISYTAGIDEIEFIRYQNSPVSGGDLPVQSDDTPTTSFEVIRSRREGATQAISINNGTETTNESGSSPTSSVDSVFIGAQAGSSNYLTADIGEIIVYSRSLALAERTRIENYLARKWGI